MPDQINFNPSVDETDISFKTSFPQICLESDPAEQLYLTEE